MRVVVAVVVLSFVAGCAQIVAADVELTPREPLPCDADPEAPRSRLPSHRALTDPAAPERLRDAMGDATASVLVTEGDGPVIAWRTSRDLDVLDEAGAESLLRRALDAVGIETTALEIHAWRTRAGVAASGEQAWRELRVGSLRFESVGGNGSSLVLGPVLDFGPAASPGVSQARAERIAASFLSCMREAAGAPPGGSDVVGLALDGATLAWDARVGSAGPACSWPDQALVDAFTGAIVRAGASCST